MYDFAQPSIAYILIKTAVILMTALQTWLKYATTTLATLGTVETADLDAVYFQLVHTHVYIQHSAILASRNWCVLTDGLFRSYDVNAVRAAFDSSCSRAFCK